ncbi:MAG TPA: GDSL-type esterase/lipase family protein, partial [Acidobacteriaceae bacterium]|nr:GDSL-type esterase/lipase family protein [Acidobacteriaceae bacterium]
GQTSVQVAARFQKDVVELHPDSVHILVGTNDLKANWVPQTTWDAFTSMIQEARAANIAVFIGTVPPWGDGPGARTSDPDYTGRNARVATLNGWLKAQAGVTVIDYDSLLVGSNGLYNPAMTDDGIHPNAAGYAVMTPAALKALEWVSDQCSDTFARPEGRPVELQGLRLSSFSTLSFGPFHAKFTSVQRTVAMGIASLHCHGGINA